MTCKEFYNSYADKNDILFTDHYLRYSDYTDAMIHFSRKNDEEKVKLLMKYEGLINKKNREKIYDHFAGPFARIIFSNYSWDAFVGSTIKIYQKKYPEFNGAFSESVIRQIVIDKNALLELICKQGYDLNAWDTCNEPKLHWTVMSDDIDYLKSLLDLDIFLLDRNIQNKYGNTALHVAIRFRNIEALKLLLTDPFVNRNIQNKYGQIALHEAVMFKNIEAIRLLSIDPRVDCNIRNNQGKTAYDYAKDSEIKELLSQRTSFLSKYVDYIKLISSLIGICLGEIALGIHDVFIKF
jgi:ankyrin repeat protein